MNRVFTLIFGLIALTAFRSNGQNIGINGTGANPDPSAMLDVSATDKGVLIPRVQLDDRTTQAPITAAPAEGLLIYNETGTEPKGYYYWDAGASQWVMVGTGAPGPYWDRDAANGWLFPANLGDNVGIGLNNPSSLLTVARNSGVIATRIGHAGGFNQSESGRLIFDEYVDNYSGSDMCGFQFHHDGNANKLFLFSDCGTQRNIQTWERTGDVGINLTNPGYQFHVTDNNSVTTTLSFNSNGNGTGLAGSGNNQNPFFTLTNGSGLAGTSDNAGVAGFGTVSASSGLYGTNDVEGTFGYVGDQNWGIYGDDGSGNAGALGGATWAGYFWGDVLVQTVSGAANIIMNDNNPWGDPGIIPSNNYFGYVGTNNNTWYYMYSYNFINPSDRNLKTDIHSLEDEGLAYAMADIEDLELAFYKYKGRADKNTGYRLGTFIDASPTYVQDDALSGIDLYDYTSLAMAGVKHLNRRVRDLEKVRKAGKDMGTVELKGRTEIRVEYDEPFARAVHDHGDPVLDLLPVGGHAQLYVASRDENGFTVGVVEGSTTNEGIQVDWKAELELPDKQHKPSIPEKVKAEVELSEAEKKRIREARAERKTKEGQRPRPQKALEHQEGTISPDTEKEEKKKPEDK